MTPSALIDRSSNRVHLAGELHTGSTGRPSAERTSSSWTRSSTVTTSNGSSAYLHRHFASFPWAPTTRCSTYGHDKHPSTAAPSSITPRDCPSTDSGSSSRPPARSAPRESLFELLA